MRYVVLLACLAACGDDLNVDVAIAPSAYDAQMTELAAHVPHGRVAVGAASARYAISIADDPSIPAEGYRIDPAGTGAWTVSAHDVLGAQYGVYAALEHLGFRFRHPYDPYVPVFPREGDEPLGVVHAPQVRVRGLHIHTLHPIEGYYALLGGGRDDAHRIIDWIVANRGNYLQWAALDDILDPQRYTEWQAATRDLIDYAHLRGIRVGMNIQLFSQSSLQHALTLVDSSTTPVADQIAARLPLVIDGLPFDVYTLSFGEFFDADPQSFIDALDETAAQLRQLAPGTEMHAIIHDGATQLVTYMGETMIYYFLVRYADPSIVPDIHTTFYFDLFEPAGGAYQMTDFSPHREYLLSRMNAGQPAAYHPEDAYWIAFDDSVPLFLPLYVRSRQLDLTMLRASSPNPLDEHLIFSSGWEWGYWLHDTTSLRASYELPASPADSIADELAPELSAAAPIVADLAEEQHTALMGNALAPYLAGRDALIDAGRQIGVISQPDRVTFDDLAGGADALAFQQNVMAPLATHVANLDALSMRMQTAHLPDDRWARELTDGVAIDSVRAHFVYELYSATLAHLGGDDAAAKLERGLAAGRLSQAHAIVASRHADRHDPDPRIVSRDANATAYAFGYLYMADQLCYWQRELDQVDAILGNTTMAPPSCVF